MIAKTKATGMPSFGPGQNSGSDLGDFDAEFDAAPTEADKVH